MRWFHVCNNHEYLIGVENGETMNFIIVFLMSNIIILENDESMNFVTVISKTHNQD